MLVDVEAAKLSLQPATKPDPNDPTQSIAVTQLVVQTGGAAASQVFPRSGAINGLLDVSNNQVPGLQAQLDAFADGLTTAITAKGVAPNGLDLFNDGGSTAYATAAKAGYGNRIAVNQSILAQPTLIRDGGTSSTSGATGPLDPGDTTYIDAVRGVFQANTLVFSGPGMAATNSLAGAAANIITGQSDHAATLDGRLQTETATQTAIDNVISQASGVNLDAEFSHLLQLQQAYATNARIVSVTQNMFNALLVASGGTATG
jgi:flagellar hook-associated protein 1